MKLTILETYNASSSFHTIQNPDSIASNWFGRKVGNVDINDYMRYEKGQDAHLEYMTPNEYLNRCVDIFNSTWKKSIAPIEEGNAKVITQYAEAMKNGDKFPIPYLDYVYNQQEGRHRALAVKQAFGEDSLMPVIVIEPTDPTEEELKNYAKQRWPKDPEWGFNYVKQNFEKFNDNEDINDIEENNIDTEEELDNDSDFDLDTELDELYDNLDEEDFLNFINQMYNSNYKDLSEVSINKFTRALDKYYNI